ncbi:TIGR00725 family protein [Chloroflexota bacterium]
MIEKKKLIAVIGGSQSSAKESKLAEEVGRELAKRGAILICGGLGGVMEAACRGAISEGGLTIGILPGESSREANGYVKIPIVTGIGYARNVVVVKSAQAVIAIGGSYGTLSEIGHALQNGIPVIGLDTWSLSRKGETNKSIIPAENAADAASISFDHIAD